MTLREAIEETVDLYQLCALTWAGKLFVYIAFPILVLLSMIIFRSEKK